MSGVDEQRPMCHACGNSSYFTFRLKRNGVPHNIWLLNEKAMKRFNYKKPVVFGRSLLPKSGWGEFIDMIEGVKCHSCNNEENFNAQTKKMANLLKHIFDREGGLLLR